MANEQRSNVKNHHDAPDADSAGLGKDLFYHGTILRLSHKKGMGIVRTSSGREIPFSYELLELLGPVRSPRELREGLVVGYDMSWTSSGLKVTRIKTYRRAGEEQPGGVPTEAAEGESEGQPSQRKDLE